jgi:hypothetical protein
MEERSMQRARILPALALMALVSGLAVDSAPAAPTPARRRRTSTCLPATAARCT